jgi:cleavage stimulation factor subunit 3
MEYHVCKALPVTNRIFEKGIELFGHEDIEIVLRYLDFLISLNDDASEFTSWFCFRRDWIQVPDARALFERVVVNYPPNHARPLWERWARYEYQYGDLESAQKLEKRIAEVYPSGNYHPIHRNGCELSTVS